MRCVRAVLLVLLIGSAGELRAGQPAGPQGIDALRAYQGEWQIKIEHLSTPYSKASREETSLRNECWQSGVYMACNQYVNGESKALVVFAYDPAKQAYTSYPIPQDGGQAGSGKLIIEKNVWTFPWETTKDGKTTYFHVVNVWTSPTTIEYRMEFSEDNKNWTVMARGVETKLK